MKYRLFSLFLILTSIVSSAFAADAILSWTNPTTNTDGSVIPASGAGSLTQTRVEYGTCSGTALGTVSGSVIALAPATTTTITGFAPGTWCFRAYSKNTYGAESVASNVTSKIVPTPIPNAPLLAVPVLAGMLQTPVYSVTAAGKISTLMGFVDVGKSCSGPMLFTYRGKNFYQVARSDVRWWGSTSLRVAAPCG